MVNSQHFIAKQRLAKKPYAYQEETASRQFKKGSNFEPGAPVAMYLQTDLWAQVRLVPTFSICTGDILAQLFNLGFFFTHQSFDKVAN